MNKTVIGGAVIALLTAGAVQAGGPGVVAPEPEPLVAAPPAWQGAYVGGTLGYAFGGEDRVGVDMATGPNVVDIDKLKLGGVNYGLRAGYRWQRENWVFGPEIALESGKVNADFETAGTVAQTELKRAVSLRWKTGYLLSSGDGMAYGIVGVSSAKFDYSVGLTGVSVDDSISRTGYVLGFGYEHKLSDRLSLTGEYEYASYGKERLFDAAGNSTQATPKFHNVKLGLNYSF